MAAAILFLDDDPERHELVDELGEQLLGARPRGLEHAWSAADAASMLARRPYDAAFLDYDLDLFQPGAPNGMTVVDFIVALPRPRRPRKVVVHSLNNGTAPARMVKRLEGRVPAVVRAPFATLPMVEEIERCLLLRAFPPPLSPPT